MQITKKKSFTRQEDGTCLGHDVYRLTKSYCDADGRERKEREKMRNLVTVRLGSLVQK